MTARATAPLRDDPLVEEGGLTSLTSQTFFEEVESCLADLDSRVTSLELRVTELEPQYIVITSADSPYAAANNDYLLCTMDGNIVITLPASGRLHVSRSGASNTLTLTGTVNGVVNPTIVADDDAPALAFIGTEWRYV